MKLQLLYVFVLAAPLLVHLLSRETKVARVETEPASASAPSEAPPAPARPADKPAPAPAAQPAAKPAPEAKQIPPARALPL